MSKRYVWVKCYACEGKGFKVIKVEDEDGELVETVEECGRCDGTGRIRECVDEDD